MPFSVKDMKSGCLRPQKMEKKTLQVRIQKIEQTRSKKAFLSVSASLTLEAAITLSLFIFATVCLILPMNIMNTDRRMQAALESIGEDFSKYAYVKEALESGKSFLIPGAGDFAKGFCQYLGEGIALGYVQGRVTDYVDSSAVKQIHPLGSSILEDGAWFDLVLDYEIQLPFPVLGLQRVNRTVRSRRRAWIGKAGKDYEEEGERGEEEDPIVYIGKNSTRYHKSRSCHYLANQLQSVSVDQVEGLRNETGGKYYPCKRCGGGSGGTVYVMSSGTSYHSTKSCSAIVAYVQTARLSQVEHLGACFYCGR